ncbi:MAG TPA: DinB family protein [Candidatus Eisenbacteria bacterium]
MTLLDRLLEHDRWTTRELLLRCRELDGSALDREFDIGLKTIRATFHHVIRNMEIWSGLMDGSLTPANRAALPVDTSLPGLECRLELAADRLAVLARDVAARGAWDDQWLDTFDDPPTRKSFGGAIGHVITHSMHHRAQIIHFLKRSGVADVPEGDLLGWERGS